MKRKVEDMEEFNVPFPKRNFSVPPPPPPPPLPPPQQQPPPPPHPQQNYMIANRGRGNWQPRGQQMNMRGVGYRGGGGNNSGDHHSGGGGGGGGSGGSGGVGGGGGGGGNMRGVPYFRGPRMPNNRGYYRGRGRGGPPRYNNYDNYDNSYQYYQKPHWNQSQQYQQDAQQPAEQQPSEPPQEADNNVSVEDNFAKTKAGKRRPMSQSYPSRPWNKEDAERALREEAAQMKGLRNQSLIIRFPDPELSKDIVKSFHPGIDNVHFQVPSGARYCFVQLSESVNPEKTIKELEQIKFGSGKLAVEKKFTKEEEDLSPEAIDPYTLYIGNLPTNVNVASVKEKFPTATRIDIGFAQRMKFTRYAFIRYNTVDEAIEAYRQTHNLVLDSRSIIVRFRRQRGHVGLPGESKPQKPKEGEKTKVKAKKEKTVKVQEEEENNDEDDEEEEEDDDDDDDEEEDDDDDPDDDDEGEEEDDDDDDEDEDEEGDEEGHDGEDDDPDDEDEDEDEDDDEDDADHSGNLFRQLDSQIDGINLIFSKKGK